MAGGVPHPLEFLGQLADALARPSQGRLRVASGRRADQSLQVGAEGSVGLHDPLAAASWPSDAAGCRGVGGLQLVQARGDGTPRDPRGSGYPSYATTTDGGRLGSGGKPPCPFIQERGELLESGSDLGISDHAL